MSGDQWNPWHEVEAANARERARAFWAQPWAYQRGPDEWVDGRPAPPPWPPGWRGTTSTCGGCPYSACQDCPNRDAWLKYLNPTPPRRSWWHRLMAHLRQGDTA